MRGLSVVKVKVYAMNGNTVFSTQASQMGDDKKNNPGFLSAKTGRPISEISNRSKFSAFENEIFNVDVVSSYIPIHNPNGKIEGVFEVYDNVTDTLAKVEWRRNLIIALVGLLFALLYLCLFLIVRRAANVMRRQHLQIADAKSRLEGANAKLSTEVMMREVAQKELIDANEQLVKSSEELKAAQQSLVQQERLATLGELTATVSHELRNPLGAIRSSLYLAKKKSEGMDLDIERALDRAERNIVRCDTIIKDLLDFASEPTSNPEKIHGDDWLRQTLAEQKTPDGIDIVTELGAPGIHLSIVQERMRRAVVNIFENATQALTDNSDDKPRRLTIRTAAQSDNYEIVFEDTGPGMEPETLSKIFEPLFSTKSYGCGLGLPTVKKIVEKHGGSIRYDSEVGTGTTVTLILPLDVAQERAA